MAYQGEAPQHVGLYTAANWQADNRPAYYFFVAFSGVNKGFVFDPVECRHADKQARLAESGADGVDLSFDDQTSAVASMQLRSRWAQLSTVPDVVSMPGNFPVAFTIGCTPETTPNGVAFAARMLHMMLETSAVNDECGKVRFSTAAAVIIAGELAACLAPHLFQSGGALAPPTLAAPQEHATASPHLCTSASAAGQVSGPLDGVSTLGQGAQQSSPAPQQHSAASPDPKTSASAAGQVSGPLDGVSTLGQGEQQPSPAPQQHSAASPHPKTSASAAQQISGLLTGVSTLGQGAQQPSLAPQQHPAPPQQHSAPPQQHPAASPQQDEVDSGYGSDDHLEAGHWHLPSDLLVDIGRKDLVPRRTPNLIRFHI